MVKPKNHIKRGFMHNTKKTLASFLSFCVIGNWYKVTFWTGKWPDIVKMTRMCKYVSLYMTQTTIRLMLILFKYNEVPHSFQYVNDFWEVFYKKRDSVRYLCTYNLNSLINITRFMISAPLHGLKCRKHQTP